MLKKRFSGVNFTLMGGRRRLSCWLSCQHHRSSHSTHSPTAVLLSTQLYRLNFSFPQTPKTSSPKNLIPNASRLRRLRFIRTLKAERNAQNSYDFPCIPPSCLLPPPPSGHLSKLVPAGEALLTLFPRQALGICKQNTLSVQKRLLHIPHLAAPKTSLWCA